MASLPELARYDAGRTIGFGQAGQKQRTLADLGQYAAKGDYKGAEAAAFSGGETELGLHLKQMNDQDKQRLVGQAASWAYGADDPQKWEQGRAQWQQMGYDIGPFQSRDALLSQAMTIQDRMSQANSDRSFSLQKQTADRMTAQAGVSKPPPGYRWSGNGDLEAIPGGPASGGRTANAPPGYRWTNDNSTLEVIPGGPAEKIPAELAARIGLANEFLRQLPGLKKDIAAGMATGPIDNIQGSIGWGRSGELRRRIQSGADALLRNLTGAGMSVSEAERYANRYEPTVTDNASTLMDKIDQLEKELRSVTASTMRGRGDPGQPTEATQQGDGPQPGMVEEGYRYLGGDPADPNSWEQAQ